MAISIVGSTLSLGIVEGAQASGGTPALQAGLIPAAPQSLPAAPATVAPRSDLVADPVPAVPDTQGLSGQALLNAMAQSGLGEIRDVRHKNPKPGDDPRDPATVQLSSGAWLLFFLDSAGNLYQQRNPGTALDPFWQSGNVIATGPVDHPDVVRLDAGGTSTLGLFYLRTVSGLAQVMARTSTTDGASWSTETQLTTGAAAVYWLRSIVVSGTAYLFWSDTAGNLFYRTSADLSTWSATATVGHLVGAESNRTHPTFDIAHLANGTWILTYLDKAVSCSLQGSCNTYNYPAVYTVVGTSLASWGQPLQHGDPWGQRWPGSASLLQTPNGTVYLAYDRYEYPWAQYVRLKTGTSDGLTWSSEVTFGCDRGIGCDGWHLVTAVDPYLFLDEQGHVQALWQMAAGITNLPGQVGVSDPYPDQLFQADLTAGIYYRPLPPYMDPSVNYGAGSLGSGIVNVASGNLILQESDYTAGGLGLPTTLTRTYNGGDTRDGIFGFGWSFPYAMGIQLNVDSSVTVQNFDGRRDYYVLNGSTYTAPPGLETTLVHNGVGTWTLKYRDHTTKTFNSSGKLTAVIDADGNTTTLAYTSGRLTTITDAAGRAFSFGYDANGRVTSIGLPLSRSLGYGYDASGNLTSFTDPTGAVTHYAYGSDHMITSVTDASGRVTTVTWTSLRRIKTVTDPAGAVTTYTYGNQSASGGSTTVTDARGTVTTHTYDSRGRQTRIEVTMPGGSAYNLVTTFAYNVDDQMTSQTDPRGVVTTYAYDTHGNVTQQVVDAGTGKLNLTTNSVYTNDDLTQRTDPRGTVTNFTYSSTHHLLSKTVHLDGSTQVTTYTYYANGLLHTSTDPNGQSSGHSSSLTYDTNGYLATATDAAGDTVTTSYDAGGRLLSSHDARGKLTTYTYDADDRKTSVTDPLDHTASYTYSPDGEQTSVTDPNGIIATIVYARSGEAVLASADTGSTGFAITNPGFEFGATGWTATSSPSIVTSPVLTGAKAAKVDLSKTYSRELPVVADATYGLTAYATATASGQTARLSYTWRNSSHTTISSGTIDVAVSTSGFLPLSLAPTAAPAGAAYLYITLGSTASGALVVFDDVVPTYSTLTDYDATGAKTSVIDANGHITRYAYDAASRLVNTTDARGKTTTLTLDKDGNTTRTTNPLATNTDSVFDNANRRTSTTVDPSGLALVSSTTYDADGNAASATDPDHHTTSFTYDRANRLVSVTDAATGLTTYAYDANGNRTSVTDARSKTTSATYDPVNRVILATDALSHTTGYGYDANGNQTSRTDANGTVTTYTFDDANRLTGVSYSTGGSVAYTYDAVGRTLTMTDGHGTTSWTYDRLGRMTQVSQPGSGAVTYTYDAVGNRTSVTAGGKTVSYAYTATNALASVTDWASRTTAYSYDDAGQPASVSYPNTIASSYTIDRAGRVTNLAYTRSGSALAAFGYTFNGQGQRITESSPEGTTGYTYDALGRLTGTTYPDTPSETFGYDAVGNRTSRTSSGATTTYAYDNANELASTTTAGSTSTYASDANGNRTSVVVPPPPDTTAPTVPSNPSATASASNEVTVSWTASSDERGVTSYLVYRDSTLVGLVSGTVTSFIDRTTAPSTAYSYTIAALDAAANASAQSSAAGATTPSGSTPSDTTPPSTPTGLSGTPVAAGRIDLAWTASTDNVGVAGYNVYRDAVKVNTVPVGSASYSDTGLVGGANHTYTVKAVDAAANESGASGSWSGAASSGALTTTYSYDAENRLTQLQSDSNVIGTYAYDGAGNRVGKTAGGVTTAYTLDLASGLPQVLTETAGSAVSSYAYAGGPLELDRSGTTNWYLADTLGSVRLLTDSTGASPATYAYSAFGSTRASTGSLTNEVRFTGERTDTESGLEFLRARTYDPSTGTFLQRDNWGITATDSQSIDAYLYTENDPANDLDPSGHWGVSLSIPDFSAVTHVALGVATFVPVVGSAAAVADAGLYAYEGDYLNAGLSLAAVVPGGAVISTGTKALKIASRADKAVNIALDVQRTERVVKVLNKADSTVNDFNKLDRAVHANSAASTRLTRLYRLTDVETGATLKYGITSAAKMTSRYSKDYLKDKVMTEITSGTRRGMLGLERHLVTLGGGPLNREPWSAYVRGLLRD
jgi:RHS repeat-associated protein